jgi:hypothetical protein
MKATRWLLFLSLAATTLSVNGCGSDDKKPTEHDQPNDAGASDTSDGSVAYQGPTRGGAIPDAPDYMEPAPDDGPFDASVPCCQETIAFAAQADETALEIEADFAPLDGAKPTLTNGKFAIELCMPLGVAIQYRLHATFESDGGSVERVRVDANTPSFEDADGDVWNVFSQQKCE